MILVFQQHKNACLREVEPAAGSCTKETEEAIQEVVSALKNQSKNTALGLVKDTTYQQHLKKIMLVYECKWAISAAHLY